MQKIVRSNSKLNKLRKVLYWIVPNYRNLPRRTVLIMGCQRSGTTVLTRVFDALPYCKVYGEYNSLANPPRGNNPLQLKNLKSLDAELAGSQFPFQVMKPLVDSQRALEVLEALPDARILWLVRDFRAVAKSNVQKFGDWHGGKAHIEAIVANRNTDWRGQNVSIQTRKIVSEYAKEVVSPIDAACLFWFARNQLFFEQGLDDHPRVAVLRYEDFVKSPKTSLDGLLRELGYPASSEFATRYVSAESTRVVDEEPVSSEIARLCCKLENKFSNPPVSTYLF